MERHGERVEVTTDEARSGSTPHIVRYVLVIGLFLVIAAFAVIWITGALSVDSPEQSTPVTGQQTPSAG